MQVEQAQSDILNELLGHVFWVEFGTEFELERVSFLNVLAHDLKADRLNIKNCVENIL